VTADLVGREVDSKSLKVGETSALNHKAREVMIPADSVEASATARAWAGDGQALIAPQPRAVAFRLLLAKSDGRVFKLLSAARRDIFRNPY
jgi:hypothetical protein